MKKSITTLALALAIIGCAVAQKPTTQRSTTKGRGGDMSQSAPKKMGQEADDKEFSLRYQINVAEVNSSYDKNSSEINELCKFIKETSCGDENKITKINICGYSSPDGSVMSNRRLATARANDFRNYLNTKCDLSKYGGETTGVVANWSDAKRAVERSSIPDKSKVLSLIESSQPQMVIEAKLRVMGSAWDYMIEKILPPMRCVQVEVFYTKCSPKPKCDTKPKAEPTVVEEFVVVENNYMFYVKEDNSDVNILENRYALPLDYEPREHIRFVFKENNRREKIKGDYRDIFGRERNTVKYK